MTKVMAGGADTASKESEMDIRSGLDGLKSLLGVPQTAATATPQVRNGSAAGAQSVGSDRATFSSAANGAAYTSGDDDVRLDKVASIQSSLAAGTYSVPASAVASSLVASMLGGN